MNNRFLISTAVAVLLFLARDLRADIVHIDSPGATPSNPPAEPSADRPAYDPFGDDDFDSPAEIADPLQRFNRAVFIFNDKAYFYVLKPAALAYAWSVPEPARRSIQRFFFNIRTPVRLINCLLQGSADRAATEFSRFLINTTFGIGGFFDPAADRYAMRVAPASADQTLSRYGVGTGMYLVLPLFGPSSARGSAGLVMDICMNPLTYADIKVWERMAIVAGETVNDTSLQIGDYEELKKISIDPYLAVRNVYVQTLQRDAQPR